MAEKNLLSNTYDYLIDGAGEYVTIVDATSTPLVTPNASLTSAARHIVTRSTGATVVARSSGKDLFTRGGTQALTSPKSPLSARRG